MSKAVEIVADKLDWGCDVDELLKEGLIQRFEYTHELSIDNRLIIPNDAKIFAQANCSDDVKFFVTSDTKSSKLINIIAGKETVTFEHMDIHTPHTQQFGVLEL